MLRYFLLSVTVFVSVRCQLDSSILDNANTPIKVIEVEELGEKCSSEPEKVTLKLFYESLCPDCVDFDPHFVKVATKLLEYLNVYTYPYGNARTVKNDNGSIDVVCQHGEKECYGNKLHACAIDILEDVKLYLEYNGCMIADSSNDDAAVKCGKTMKIPPCQVRTMTKCAKSAKGQELLVHYGEESQEAKFTYVPYVLINNTVWNGEAKDFMKDVCATFTNPPDPCLKYVNEPYDAES